MFLWHGFDPQNTLQHSFIIFKVFFGSGMWWHQNLSQSDDASTGWGASQWQINMHTHSHVGAI